MFKPVEVMKNREIIQMPNTSVLDISNGKFLAVIVCMLVMFVTFYTKSIEDDLADSIRELQFQMQNSDTAIRKDISHLTTGQDKNETAYMETRRELDQIKMVERLTAPILEADDFSHQEAILRQVLNKLNEE